MVHCSTDVADINEKSQSVTDSAFTDAVSQGLRGPALIKNILADFHRKIKKQMYGYPQS